LSNAHEAQEFSFNIPGGYSVTARRELAERVISKIIERTENGIDKNNKQWPELSAKYKEFKQAATGNNTANLRFTGELHGDLEYKPSKSSASKLVVGYKEGTISNAKAKGHITGDIGVKRDFLGLPQQELDSMFDTYQPDEISLIDGAINMRSLLNKVVYEIAEVEDGL
jgi:hypothetical protein